MNDEALLANYLSLWQQDPRQKAEELCREHPHLAEALKRRIDSLRRLEALAGEATLPPEESGPVDPAATLAPLESTAGVWSSPGAISPPGYEILGELGRGGMGVVYKARQTGLERDVALKMILSGGHADEASLERFRVEGEAIARLQHPNIIQVFEVGEHAGLPFFSLEYCERGSLENRLKGTPLTPGEAAQLVESLARAMHVAHSKGILHRDLKPANVLLDGNGVPKITDFGLAKKLEEQGKTATGAILGTPSYMAPEQAGGDPRALGPACDVYALGAILYECLTGRPPFKAATALDTVMQVVSDEPAPPSQLQSSTPKDINTICMKCLQKEPRRRYASAEALAEDLRRFLEDRPVKARPIGLTERTWRWCRRNRALATALLAGALALLAGTVAATAFAVRSSQNAARAEAALELANEKDRQSGDLLYATAIGLAHREWQTGLAHGARIMLRGAEESRRGWEWHYLNHLFDASFIPLPGHNGRIRCGVLLPDGSRALTGAGDKTVRAWSGLDGTLQRVDTLPNVPHRMALSPDGHRVAIASGHEVIISDPTNPQNSLTIPLSGPVCGIGFLPGGEEVLLILVNGESRVYEIQKGIERRKLPRLPLDANTRTRIDLGHGVAVSPNGSLLAQGGADGRVRAWEASTGRVLLDVVGHLKDTGQVAFHPDGKRLASPGGEGSVRIWDLEKKITIREIRVHSTDAHAVAFSPDGKLLVSVAMDTTVRVFDAETGERLLSLTGHEGQPMGVAFGGNDRALTWGLDGIPRIWDFRERVYITNRVREHLGKQDQRGHGREGSPELLSLYGHLGPVSAVALSPDGRLAATAAFGDDQVVLWDIQRRTAQREVRSFTVTPNRGHRLAFSPEGTRLAIGTGGGGTPDPAELTVFDVATGLELWRFRGGPPCIELRPVFSPDGHRLSAASVVHTPQQGKAHLLSWDSKDGHLLFNSILPGPSLRASYTPDGQSLLTAGADQDGGVKFFLWDATNGNRQRDWAAPRGLTDAVCGPTGVVAGADALDATVALYNLERGQLLRELKGHTGSVPTLAFSPDGSRLLSGGGDFTARIWHIENGATLLRFREHNNAISNVSWSDDGSTIATACMDGAVRIWQGPTSTTPRTDHWVPLIAEDFERDNFQDLWVPVDGTWEIRGGKLRGTQIMKALELPQKGQFPIAQATLKAVTLPRTFEMRCTCQFVSPTAVVFALSHGLSTKTGFGTILDGSGKLFGKPQAFLMQISEGMRMSYPGVRQPLSLAPGSPHEIRLLREPNRLRVWVDGQERLNEPISEVDLTKLTFQGSWGAPGESITFDNLTVRAPATAIREHALRSQAEALFQEIRIRDEVRRRLRSVEGITDSEQVFVDRVVGEFVEDPRELGRSIESLCLFPKAGEKRFALALLQAESLAKTGPDNPDTATLLGIAQVRSEKYKEALRTLTRALAGTQRVRGASLPRQHAFLALAHQGLGEPEPAREHVTRLRDLLRGDRQAADKEARALLEEVEAACPTPRESPDSDAIKSLVTRADQDGWMHRNLKAYLAMFAPEVRTRDGRGATATPQDPRLDRQGLENVRRREFSIPPNPDSWISYENLRVHIRGNDAEFTARWTAHFPAGFITFQLAYQLTKTPAGWRVRQAESWPLVLALDGPRVECNEALWAERDRTAHALRTGEPLAYAKALAEAWRWADVLDATKGAIEGKKANAEIFVLRGDALHKIGHIAESKKAFRIAVDLDAEVPLPWYLMRLRGWFGEHQGGVKAVAYHPDGKRVLSAGDDGTARLWMATTRNSERIMRMAKGRISGATLSPDGSLVATGGEELRLWDGATGETRQILQGHEGHIFRVAFHPNGQLLVSAGADKTARIWNTAKGDLLSTLHGHTREVLGAVFSPDGTLVATASWDGTARIWDAHTGAWIRTLEGHTDRLLRVAFHPDGKRLATCSHDRTLRFWDIATGKLLQTFKGHESYVEVVVFSPDGTLLASADGLGIILVHEVMTGRRRQRLGAETAGGPVIGLAFRPDGKMLAAAGSTGVHLWDVSTDADAP